MSAITDNRRQRFFAPPQEYNLVQLVEDAKTRWLKPIEVCEILSNHQRLQLSRNPPSKPSSGSMFLFDRKALRYFRKDGHNWRKKKDGKTVREAHEKLKAGSVDVLHCYYAHGEDNPKFQRRSYWMLDGAYEHIVLVHYREVIEGNRACLASSLPNTLSTDGTMQNLPQQSAQNSIYWDANSYFPPSFDSSPSEILSSNMNQEDEAGSEEEFDNSTTPWEGREGQPISFETGVRELDTSKVTATNNFQKLSSSLGLGTTITAVSGPTNLTFYKSGSLSFPNTSTSELQQLQIDALNKNDNQQQPQTGSYKGDWLELENMDMSELLEHQGSGKLSTAETLDSSTWKQLLDSANSMAEGKLSNWKELLDQLPPPSSGEVSEPMVTRNIAVNANISSFEIKSEVDSKIDSFLPDNRSDGPMLTRSLLEALSPKGLGRKPQTALEAHLQETIQKNSLRKAAAEEDQYHRHMKTAVMQDSTYSFLDQDIMDSTSSWKSVGEQQQNNNLVYLGSMHKQNIVNHDPQEWRLQIQQQIKHQGQDEVHSLRKEHFLQSHSLKPVGFDGSGLLLPNTSESLKGIQSDTGSFKKQDSFGSWIAKEFGDSQDISLSSSSVSESYWEASIEDQRIMGESLKLSQQVQLNAVLSSSLSQEQHFSIVDFSPEWSYSSDETKVIVSGMYLDKLKSPTDYKWCCMFGEIEVAAEILPTGALRCRAPPHEPGRVPFYLTCNDRVACSEIREFEYRAKPFISGEGSATDTISVKEEEEMLLKVRFSRLLSTTGHVSSASENDVQESTELSNQECALCIEENEWIDLESLATGMRQDFQGANEKLLQALLKQKLQQWLHCQVHKEGKGASIFDEHGVGVLHMAAALGYEWAIAPILAAGVGVNFRDTRGWTALHWAAHCGREKVVVALLAADASAGALTDPTPKCPTGHTAADLAASRRHGGIAGYLAEASLTSHLSLLNVRESEMDKISAVVAGDIAVEAVSEKCSVNPSRGLTEDELSLKDTLAAVRNAAQAATRIQAVFRAHSFRKKQQAMESRVDEFGMLQGEVRSIAAAQLIQRAYRGHREKLNLAATQIQCKYRGWKGRKDFLTLKHQVVKIQAHVRGHQVRKKYKILWTVGVLDKAILRWRRKGHGLRGFRSEENGEEDSNDEDFLKDFRRQKEAAFEEELTRVQCMVQSPEAQHQYRRMLENFQRTKVGQASEATVDEEELLMSLLD